MLSARSLERVEGFQHIHGLGTDQCLALMQVEEFEYEIEELQGNMKKKQKPPPRLAELEEIIGHYKEHVDNLEKVQCGLLVGVCPALGL